MQFVEHKCVSKKIKILKSFNRSQLKGLKFSPIMVTLCSVLSCSYLLCSKLCWHNWLVPTAGCKCFPTVSHNLIATSYTYSLCRMISDEPIATLYADDDSMTTPASNAEALNKQFYSVFSYKGRQQQPVIMHRIVHLNIIICFNMM